MHPHSETCGHEGPDLYISVGTLAEMPGNFDFRDLHRSSVRTYMVEEAHADIAESVLYYSTRFNSHGMAIYKDLLLDALANHDEVWLEAQLSSQSCFLDLEDSGGGQKKVGSWAAKLFCQCEFNKFYIRGLCRFALENPGVLLRVYRARESSRPRPESDIKIGQYMDPAVTLSDLRSNLGTGPKSGMPDINSGLSVEIVSI